MNLKQMKNDWNYKRYKKIDMYNLKIKKDRKFVIRRIELSRLKKS